MSIAQSTARHRHPVSYALPDSTAPLLRQSTPPFITMRPATALDLSSVLAIYAQPAIDDGMQMPLHLARLRFTRFAQYPQYELHVACVDGDVVGTFTLLIRDSLMSLGMPSAVLADLAVAPAWQRRGIGRSMVAHAIRRSRDAGCHQLALISDLRRPAAEAFCAALGFQHQGLSLVVPL